ncbi:MAG TPA: insulinase family protein [Longimicrobiaceae bacterium]|nr:insulinase family protein [Longimicrobiaceae bacterium]
MSYLLPLRRAALCLLAAAGLAPLAAGPAHAQRGRLPQDTGGIVRRLPNGLTYHVRVNREPPARAELRLVVNAGSVLEDEDQRGLAHFVEHMAFNGTRRFAKHELVDYLESVGMRFGPDVNAYTSFDETVYMLTLPTDTAGVLEKGLDILEDWATGITFDTAEVRKERGVVVEEWRLGRGAGARVQDRQFPILFAGSRYAERLPIGDVRTLETATAEALRRFYQDWYRPELMAVVAVGDFDPAQMEAMIRERFGRIPRTLRARTRTVYDVQGHRGTRYSSVTDPELSSSQVTIMHTTPARSRWTLRAYREGMVESLYSGLINDRLNEITQRPGAPFLGVFSSSGALLRTVDAFVLSAEVPDGGAERGLEALLVEARRAARHGFTAAELEREKAEVLRMWEQMWAERGKATSAQFAGQFVGQFLYGGPLLSIDTEYELHRSLLPGITLAEVDRRARAWLARPGRALLFSGPERPGLRTPGPDELAAAVARAARARTTPYTETVSTSPLLAQAPEAGRVVAEDSLPEIGVTRWTLSNGARVVLKPTDYREEEVFLVGRSPGGTSLVPDSAFLYARTATAAAQVGGVGTLSVVDLSKRLSGQTATVGVDIGELHEGLTGYAAPRDLETLFQLVYLYFTSPRRDTVAWEAYRQRARETLRNRGAGPEEAFGDTLSAVLTGHHLRARPLTSASFDSISLDRSLEIFRDRFSDAGDFTFYLVGNFEPAAVRPLVERYLAALPATGRAEAGRDVGMRVPRGVVRHTVRRGLEPKGETQIVFSGPLEFSRRNAGLLRSLADVLELRLREKLREELGGTYGVGVGASAAREPRPEYRVSIGFGAAPERLEELTRSVFAEIDSLKTGGVTELDLAKVRESHRRQLETNLRDNNFWLTQLLAYDRYGWDPRLIPSEPLSLEITAAELREAARRFLDTANYVQVSLFPEPPPPPAGATRPR